jgi:hypothetical protein
MHRLSTAIVNIILMVPNYLAYLSTIHIGYPLIHYSQGRPSVDSAAGGGELSTLIHSARLLWYELRGQ